MTALMTFSVTDHKTVCKHAMLSFLHNVISKLPLLIAGEERGKSPAQQGITYTVDDLLTTAG